MVTTLPSNLRLEWLDPSQLQDNPRNWRRHPDAQTRAMRDILDEVGWAGVLLYNEATGHLIDGHLRKEIATGPVPVLIGSWSEENERKILLTLDPLSYMAEQDADILTRLIEDTSFTSESMDEVISLLVDGYGGTALYGGNAPEDPGPQLDRAEELRDKWHTERGQVWEIGEHRLMCGDSTNVQDIRLLMQGIRAMAVITDPPYLVDYDGGRHPQSWSNARTVRDKHWDSYRDQAPATGFYELFIQAAIDEAVDKNASWYQWYASLRAPEVHDAWRNTGLLTHVVIVWVKSRAVLTHSRYMWQHELCVYGWQKGNQPLVKPPANATTVWEVDQKGDDDTEHPTQKPSKLIRTAIEHSTNVGELCYEPFSGSGTTMVAAEQLGRLCYGMEIEPKYVAVSLQRMADMGLEPRLT